MVKSLKGAWEVTAGVIPGVAVLELTKTWVYTAEDHAADQALLTEEEAQGLQADRPDATLTRFQKVAEEAGSYWCSMNDPRVNNWAMVRWIWY